MTNGPIEWMSEGRRPLLAASEYGGGEGLIQSSSHVMTPSEAQAMLARAGMTDVDNGDEVMDPCTGRLVPNDLNQGIA